MKKIDLIGQRFNFLTVIEEAEPIINSSGRRYIAWKCQCDCGNTVIVRTDYLRNGHTKSCGCLAGRTNITGERFGRLTVLSYSGGGKYLCLCDCGKETIVNTYNLKNGTTKSCGCLQKEKTSEASLKSLLGQKFGKLTVIKRVKNNRYNHVCYLCKCDCGGEVVVDAGNLRNGNTNSCGCIKSKGEMKIQQWLQEHNIKYIPQYSFDDIFLSSGRRPFYDFALLDEYDNVIAILEYQGAQHYGYSDYGWNNKENYLQTRHRDKEKQDALIKRKIPLYKIPYWELDNLNEMLGFILKLIAIKAVPDMEEEQEVIE